jgi:hypothetical protein
LYLITDVREIMSKVFNLAKLVIRRSVRPSAK